MSEKMITLYTNFARYGEPTPDKNNKTWANFTEKWEVFDLERENYMLVLDNFTHKDDIVLRWNYYNRNISHAPIEDTDPHGVLDNVKNLLQLAHDSSGYSSGGSLSSPVVYGLTAGGCGFLLTLLVFG